MSGKKSKADRGLFRRRGSPHWWLRYADRNGRIRRESTNTDVKGLAREILAKKKVLVAENRHLDVRRVPNTTFFELCERYWKTVGQFKRGKGLKDMIGIWKGAFGNVALKELTQKKIEQFLSKRMETDGIAPATRNRHLATLRSVLNKGKAWEMLLDNPAAGIKRLRENGARTRFLDLGEIKSLLEAADAKFKPILIAALHTGMRRGEILNLKWGDVDLANRMITIQQSKSGRKRTIPIDDTLHETLKMLPSRFRKGYVFPSPLKRRANMAWVTFERLFQKAVADAKLADFRFHDLRHTFASHLVMNGVDIKTVQELLGHADLTMTARYAHLAPAHRTRAIKILDSALQTDTKTDTVGNQANNPAAVNN